jgi:enterochelin esterase family protein
MEYLLELADPGGARESVLDPANPKQVAGAFGRHSVVEFPDYRPPWWLAAPVVDGLWTSLSVRGRALGAAVQASVWSPAGVADSTSLPLLVAHDGPEYDAMSALSRFCAAMIAGDALPPHRLALLAPGDRDQWYSCSAAYASSLTGAVLPAVRSAVRTLGAPVGMGASLGGLAMLHAQRRHPGSWGALFLQSGSFFHPAYDAHEQRFARYRRVIRFVEDTLRADTARETLPVALTCGAVEENLHNNRLIARALSAQGYDLRLDEVPDAHNYTAWRDAFDPHLTRLLRRMWTVQ